MGEQEKRRLLERLRVLEQRARYMRKHPTPAEDKLSGILEKDFSNIKFLYQVVVMPFYIVDVLCPGASLIIEVDGDSHHLTRAKDALRADYLLSKGYRILHLSNDLVFDRPFRCITMIRYAILSALKRQ